MTTIETKLISKSQKNRDGALNQASENTFASPPGVTNELPAAYVIMQNVASDYAMIHPLVKDENKDHEILVKVNSVIKRIKTKDIYLIEGLCDYINIYTDEKRYTIYSTMYGILEKLPEAEFMRIHRSFIVRIDRITSMENNMLSVEMRCVPVSKTYKKEVLSKLKMSCC